LQRQYLWQIPSVHLTSLAKKLDLAETVSVAGPVSQPVAGPVSPPDTLAMKHGLVKTVPVAGPYSRLVLSSAQSWGLQTKDLWQAPSVHLTLFLATELTLY
jgi:hypothetical protein